MDTAAHRKSDILSSTLSQLKLSALMAGATDAAGRWSMEIPEHDGFKLYLVLQGERFTSPQVPKRPPV